MKENIFSLIKEATPFLSTEHAIVYQQYLRTSLSIAVDIIQVIQASDTELTLVDVSKISGISIGTVTETIRALRLGGYPFVVKQAGTQGNKLLIGKQIGVK